MTFFKDRIEPFTSVKEFFVVGFFAGSLEQETPSASLHHVEKPNPNDCGHFWASNINKFKISTWHIQYIYNYNPQ